MEQLNINEQRVLELVRQDPYLTQAEIGETLNLNRSTVATIIQALTRKGRIQGRAYVGERCDECVLYRWNEY